MQVQDRNLKHEKTLFDMRKDLNSDGKILNI